MGRVDDVTLCIPLHHISFGFSKISDILTKSLLNEALEWDFKDNGNKPPKDRNICQTLLNVFRNVACLLMFGRKGMLMEKEVAYMTSPV